MSAEPSTTPVAWYRHAPYQLFFPIGGLLSLLGVVQWGAFALGWSSAWRPSLHAIIEIQSALSCFAVGFLFTFVPRRTRTAAPTTVEVGAALLLLIAPGVALFGHERLAHAAWALLALFLCVFTGRRLRSALRAGGAVAQFIWLPVSFGLGLLGALAAAIAPGAWPWARSMGTALVWQGVLTGLVIGIGGMLLPMVLHREPHRGDPSRRAWFLHAVAAAVFASSFAVDWLADLRWGHAIRAVVAVGMLVGPARLLRWPRAPGLHRRVAWLAAWMIPLGFAAVALWPVYRTALLHLTFLPGFMLLTLAIANHVIIAHGGRDTLLFANPVPLYVMGAAVALATCARLLVAFDPARLRLWAGAAFFLFALALAAWASWVLPRLRPAPPTPGGAAS
jgi:uncharacterized protein involved in response to NO